MRLYSITKCDLLFHEFVTEVSSCFCFHGGFEQIIGKILSSRPTSAAFSGAAENGNIFFKKKW